MRLLYKPMPIKILMIADAPPLPNTHFFYDHTTQDTLRKCSIEAFRKALPNQSFVDDLAFLHFLKENGFYLDDLCHTSLHDTKKSKDKDAIHTIRAEGKALLTSRLRQYQSDSPLVAIISVAKEIKHYVDDAIFQAKIPSSVLTYNIAFPSPEWQRNQLMYVDSLTKILLELKKKRII